MRPRAIIYLLFALAWTSLAALLVVSYVRPFQFEHQGWKRWNLYANRGQLDVVIATAFEGNSEGTKREMSIVVLASDPKFDVLTFGRGYSPSLSLFPPFWTPGYSSRTSFDPLARQLGYHEVIRTSRSASLWLFQSVATVPILLLSIWKYTRNKVRRKGECSRCGYDLRASPERCPECGTLRADAR